MIGSFEEDGGEKSEGGKDENINDDDCQVMSAVPTFYFFFHSQFSIFNLLY